MTINKSIRKTAEKLLKTFVEYSIKIKTIYNDVLISVFFDVRNVVFFSYFFMLTYLKRSYISMVWSERMKQRKNISKSVHG